ncbi:unnamed protein product [Mytilus coruscus]|uniref:Uncharacterized protein n=1 Tax=Mytilus coruscus TaxID=42192 RepID=A0A6J8BKB5_MYTCO|nr:unnamed protein product [Mytilus coruscus]
MSGVTENKEDKSHDDNTSTKEKYVSISKEEIEKPHFAEVHHSPGAESFPERSTDSSSSVAQEEFTDFISSMSTDFFSKPIQISKAKNAPQKLKSISHNRREKKFISDKNKINTEFSDKKTLVSSDNKQTELQSKQNLIYPYDVSSDKKVNRDDN